MAVGSSEELSDFFSLSRIRLMRWARHMACMGEMRNTKFWSENLKGGPLE